MLLCRMSKTKVATRASWVPMMRALQGTWLATRGYTLAYALLQAEVFAAMPSIDGGDSAFRCAGRSLLECFIPSMSY